VPCILPQVDGAAQGRDLRLPQAMLSALLPTAHALGRHHASVSRLAKKFCRSAASALIQAIISVIAVVFVTPPYAWLHLQVYGLAEARLYVRDSPTPIFPNPILMVVMV